MNMQNNLQENVQHISQQVNQCQQIIQQLVQQTEQSNQVYQQMIQQEQQNITRIEEIAQRERQSIQTLQNSLHGHQIAIQKMNQAAQLCAQLEHAVRLAITNQNQFQNQNLMNQNAQFQQPSTSGFQSFSH
jgi:hypothetical protein